jgi:23S rRNA pseudouridine1911/1915/1917 synthase
MVEPKVIYENKDFLVVNKPAGLMVHGARISDKGQVTLLRQCFGGQARDKDKKEAMLVDWLLERYPEIKTVGDDPAQRPGIVHRLDKDTSGVMLVARNQASFDYLKSLFQKHEIVKTYHAVVWGKPKNDVGVIDAPIGILTGSTRRSVRSAKMAKEAVTEYKVLKNFQFPISNYQLPGHEEFSLLEVQPKTGRTHQIRVHLASINHPILGDKLYGTKLSRAASPRLMLHALSIEFTAPDGKKMRFEAEPPKEFKDFS